ncbi:MAG: glycosyltransferase family 39 protein [bacterium]
MSLLVPAFLAAAVCYSLCIPRWQNSDEPFHYFYVKRILYEGRLPTREETYEAAHPPLYYAAAAAWALPFRGRDAGFLDNWIRLLSALFGAVSVYFLYRMGRDGLGAPWLGAGMAAAAAVNPMFVATSAVVSNDAGVICAGTVAIYVMLVLTRGGGGARAAAACGLAAGVSCLFKITANFLPPFFAFFYLFHPDNRGRGWKRLALELALFLLVFSAVAGWWYVLGWSRIGERTLFNKLENAPPHPLYSPSNFAWFLKTLMLNLWLTNDYLRGEPAGLPLSLKAFYFALSGAAVLLMGAAPVVVRRGTDPLRRHLVLSFLFCVGLFLGQQAAINMRFPTAQARYMFPMYGPVSALALIPLASVLGERFVRFVPAFSAVGFVLHAVWVFAYLVPLPGPPFVIS